MHVPRNVCFDLALVSLLMAGFAAGGRATNDPYLMPEISASGSQISGFRNTNGRTQVDCTLSATDTNLVLVTLGQSTMAANAPTAYVPTNAKVHTYNPYDGGCYVSRDPQLGSSQVAMPNMIIGPGHVFGRIGDKLISAGPATRVIGANIAIDATFVADWAAGGSVNGRIGVLANRLKSAPFGIGGVSAVLWQQGESDCVAGTSQASYAASLASVIATLRNAGFTAPIFIAHTTWVSGSTCPSTVGAAQDAAVNHGAGIWAGPNSDSLGAGSRLSDNIHFSDAGNDSLAALWQAALHAYGAPF
jgi:hypothetical protein